jgi:hypothetical protein
VNRKALAAEAALSTFMVASNLYDSDMRTLEAALEILRREAKR